MSLPRSLLAAAVLVGACASRDGATAPAAAAPPYAAVAQPPPIVAPVAATPPPVDAGITPGHDAIAEATADAAVDPPVAVVAADPGSERWLKGSTHIHAKPSGDSHTPVPDVIRWYERHGYDFIVVTDHNVVSEVDPMQSTAGRVAIRYAPKGLVVLAGIELTHNPNDCIPPGDPSGRCRIHVNLLGVTSRPTGKIKWANHKTNERLLKYQAALDQRAGLGGIAQLNHPQWYWGMTGELLAELAGRGMALVEIANAQFATWNAGDADHPSTEALWDDALGRGATLWGVASDDAHQYNEPGKYPAGGGWVMVRARRDPAAILDALAHGRFYASNGVVLERAEVSGGALTVEVAAGSRGIHTIEFIENGKRVQRARARKARRAVPATGYVRAVVTRADGKMAWVQPARATP
ncbi:MAG: CehA/McbA family metallohydrolase [Kofleriaceae bacterium]